MTEDMQPESVPKKKVSEGMLKKGQKDVRKNASRYLRQNARKYVPSCEYITWITRNHVCTNGLLWMAFAFLFLWRTAAGSVGSSFFLCKETKDLMLMMEEVVAENSMWRIMGSLCQMRRGKRVEVL